MSAPLEFSVIIPARNRSSPLAACLTALAQQNFPRELFEVIVVDDGSDRPLRDACAPFEQRLQLRVLEQEQTGPGPARNTGAAAARGTFLAFTDDDCAPHTGWLQAFNAGLTSDPECLFGGRIVNALTANVYSATAQIILDTAYAYYNSGPEAQFFASCNFALARQKFYAMGGFDPAWPVTAAEDRAFCHVWRSRGWTMRFLPEAVIEHRHELDWSSFWRLFLRYGRGADFFHRVRDPSGSLAGVLPDWTFYRECCRQAGNAQKLGSMATVAFLLATWQAVNAVGYAAERYGNRARLGRLKTL